MNGSTHPAPRLRWLWFGGSILSDWNNPHAVTNRAIIRDLQALGQTVEYLEPADHPAFHEALRAEGSGFYRDFQERYPDIRYRRVTLPRQPERDVWLSREVALVDALIVEAGAPGEVFDWLERLPESRLVRILLTEQEYSPRPAFDLVIGPGEGARTLIARVVASRSKKDARE